MIYQAMATGYSLCGRWDLAELEFEAWLGDEPESADALVGLAYNASVFGELG